MEVLTMKICDILNNNESENLLKEWLELEKRNYLVWMKMIKSI